MRRTVLVLSAVFLVLASGCGTTAARTVAFFAPANVGAMVALPDGGVRYGDKNTGDIFDTDTAGNAKVVPLTKVGGGLVGLAIDDTDRTFAAWTNSNASVLTVAQVLPGPTRVLWSGNTTSGGRLTFTPERRLLVTLENQLISLDPDRGVEQHPNVVSTGWHKPAGVTYATGNVLWMVDDGAPDADDRLVRPGESGPNGQVTDLGRKNVPVDVAAYGDRELVVCFAGTGKLQRFLLDDGVQAVPGRVIAKDCKNGVVQLKDGRLAYATDTEIRVTAL